MNDSHKTNKIKLSYYHPVSTGNQLDVMWTEEALYSITHWKDADKITNIICVFNYNNFNSFIY